MTLKPIILAIVTLLPAIANSSNNGLGLTPPMGWLSWERFRCLTDCVRFPDECLSEQLVKRTADRMASDGYLEAGYEYVIIDDCWSSKSRDASGKLQADPDRFPSGVKALADYVHDLDLKFGIYSDYGTLTCAGYPGSAGHLELDAETFAEWGVDYVKMDACNGDEAHIEDYFVEMSGHLNQTGRPIFCCQFTSFLELYANYSKAVEYCNSWRTTWDIDDRWADVRDIATFYADHQDFLRQYAGPGGWNDPDMVVIGNFGLSFEQSKSQMTLWSILAAPLILSVDFDTIKPEFKAILQNKQAIRVNQDPLGVPGEFLSNDEGIMLWIKPLTDQETAIGLVSNRTDGFIYAYDLPFGQYVEGDGEQYMITNVFEEASSLNGVHAKTEVLTVRIPPTGAMLLIVSPNEKQEENHL